MRGCWPAPRASPLGALSAPRTEHSRGLGSAALNRATLLPDNAQIGSWPDASQLPSRNPPNFQIADDPLGTTLMPNCSLSDSGIFRARMTNAAERASSLQSCGGILHRKGMSQNSSIQIAAQNFVKVLGTRDWDLLRSILSNAAVWELPGNSAVVDRHFRFQCTSGRQSGRCIVQPKGQQQVYVVSF
jgi:hypothetical protein